MTTFYFTLHPGDLSRARILPGAHVMLVAHSCWDADRKRLKVRRPPADHIGALVIDSGGFTAAKKWGRYPWSVDEYALWIRQVACDVDLRWAACMDYACERDVNRETYRTNMQRIQSGIENEMLLRERAPGIPWLGVLQGNTLEERAEDIARRRDHGLLHPLMGVGSICGRKAREAAMVLRFYGDVLPRTRYHAFGLDSRALDQGDDVAFLVESWDSYAWNWPRGSSATRPGFLTRAEDESYTTFTRRLGEIYWRDTIQPRLTIPRQLPLEVAS